ncbi:EGF conserved site containing protein, putative [Babesia ovis]|uniref:EGF conserved site containing protein, putative n=1 Tax=Babesia ovis TaxID=5869 RepID=A0A9W5TCQ0_BABOV|nr:EGF conserved site containing protein, putative [Babesia ovis]
MEALLSLYRQAVAADIKDTLQPANAHTLQRLLYENSDVFGNLCKYDNFHCAFGVPPNPCESVNFIRFWRGVEDAITGPESVINGLCSIELQKILFMDDELLRSMRYFRDELLKHHSPMMMSTFFSVIDSCSRNSDMEEFWLRVRDNSREMFSCGDVDTNEVSDMIFGHLSQRFSLRPDADLTLQTVSTCISVDVEDDLRPTPTARSLLSGTLSSRSTASSDERYRQLLEDLDICLPAVYNRFCERIDELTSQREQLETECEIKEKQLDDLRNEFSDCKRALQSRCDQLLESNTMLHQKIESHELELDSYRIHMDNMKRRLDSHDSSRFDGELQTLRLRCDDLEQMNAELRTSLSKAESIQSARSIEISDRIDACVGDDVEYTDTDALDPLTSTEPLPSQEREAISQELANLRTENSRLCGTIHDLRSQVDSLSHEREAALLENSLVTEKMKLSISLDQHIAEQKTLKDRIMSLEADNISLRDNLTSLRKDGERAEAELSTLVRAKSDLDQELRRYKGDLSTYKHEIDLLRQKCAQLEADSAAKLHLQFELRSKIDSMTKENNVMAARIEELTAPQTNTSGTTGIDDCQDSGCSAITPRTDTTECDDYEGHQRVVSSANLIKINPALAETRRLNTLNAMKHGQLNIDDTHISLSSFNSGVGGALVYRQVFGIQRAMTVISDDDDIGLLRDPRELGLDSDTASLSESESPDVIQSAATYFSDTFNLGLRASGRV